MDRGHKSWPYQIVSRLGQGGMGEVFQARDTRLDRNVAIKIAHAEFAKRLLFTQTDRSPGRDLMLVDNFR